MSGPGRAPEATVGNDPAYALAGASSPTAAMRHSVSFFTASPLVPCRRPRRVRGPEPAIEHGDAVALLVGQREVEDVEVLGAALVRGRLGHRAHLGLVEQPAQRDLTRALAVARADGLQGRVPQQQAVG